MSHHLDQPDAPFAFGEQVIISAAATTVPVSAAASPTSTSRSYNSNNIVTQPLQLPHHRTQPSDAFTSTNIPHHARKRTQQYQQYQPSEQQMTPIHTTAVPNDDMTILDIKAASSVTSPFPSDSGTICAAPIRIEVRNLTAIRQEKHWLNSDTITSEKTILHNLTAQFEPGKLIGIMGGSGSGKTSLLNLLANRGGVRETFSCTGDILFNGRPGMDYGTDAATEMTHTGVGGATTNDPTQESSTNSTRNILLERRLGYVRQHDSLLPHVTVYETLMYAAQLRLSSSMSSVEKESRVEQILRELNLTPIRNSLVGDEKTKGISGGEKRRVSVAVQMLSDPSVLFLDEPTTGLDSYTAHHLIKTLSHFAHTQNRTVIATIHQPRSSIFSQFSSILILVRGQVVFQGSPDECMEFLEQEGFPVPNEVNPADFMLDLVTIDGRNEQGKKKGNGEDDSSDTSSKDLSTQRERDSLRRVRALKRGYESWKLIQQARVRAEKHTYFLPSTQDIQADLRKAEETAGFSTQMRIVLVRTFRSLVRDKTFLLAQLLTSLSFGIMLGLIFYQPPLTTSAGLHTRSAALWLVSSLYYFLNMIYTIYHFSTSIFPAADQEMEDGMYSPGAFLVGMSVAHFPFYVLFSCVYMILIYTLVGLRLDDGASHMFIAFLCSILQTNACVSIALFCVSMSRPFNDASMTANSLWTFFNLSGGFLVASASLPKYVKWIQSISYLHYGWRMMMTNEWSGRMVECVEQVDGGGGSCIAYDGERILEEFSMSSNDYQTPLIGLVAIWFAFTLISYLLLVLAPSHPGSQAGSTAGGAKTEGEKEKEKQKEKELDLDVMDEKDEEDELQVDTIPPPPPPMPQLPSSHSTMLTVTDTTTSWNSAHPPPPPPPPPPFGAAGSSNRGHHRITSRGFRVSICEQYDPVVVEEAAPVEPMQPVMRRLSTQVGAGNGKKNEQQQQQSGIRPMLAITLKNITLKIPKTDSSSSSHKILLSSISTTIPSGKLVVMMGSSGAGKSTLLDILSHRSSLAKKKGYMTGEVLFNNQRLDADAWESVVGYVQQHDTLLPFLTVEETFQFAATLRLPSQTTPEERLARVTEVIEELGLQRCRNTLIGSHEVKGISGGEIRRVSIGIQMLTDPSILILDEPTSGLDTFTAFQLIHTLRRIARKGRTVLCSLHQPRSDIYSLFDRILLLAPGGHLIFSGAREEVASYFSHPSLAMHCDLHTNPADWLLDHTCLDFRTKEGEVMTKERNEKMVRVWKERNGEGGEEGQDKLVIATSSLSSSTTTPDIQPLNRASFTLAFSVLSHRSLLNLLRQPGLILSRAIQIVLVAIVLLLYYARLSSNQESIQNRMGLIEEFSVLLFVGMLNNIAIYPTERNIFYREYSERSYATLPFVLNYTIMEVVCEMIGILLLSILVMYVCDMQAGAANFFLLFFITFCYTNAGESFGMIFCSVVYSPGISVTIANAFLTIFAVMIGIFSLSLPTWLDVINHLSILKFGTSVLGRREFHEMMFTCDTDQMIDPAMNGKMRCPIETGDEVLQLYQFDRTTDLQDLIALAALCIGYRLLAFVAVWRAAGKNHSGAA